MVLMELKRKQDLASQELLLLLRDKVLLREYIKKLQEKEDLLLRGSGEFFP